MQIKELPLCEMGMNCSFHKVTKGSASTRHSAYEMENAEQMLTVNIQDEGKAHNLSKTRGHQEQEETPLLGMRERGQATRTVSRSVPFSSLKSSKEDFPMMDFILFCLPKR